MKKTGMILVAGVLLVGSVLAEEELNLDTGKASSSNGWVLKAALDYFAPTMTEEWNDSEVEHEWEGDMAGITLGLFKDRFGLDFTYRSGELETSDSYSDYYYSSIETVTLDRSEMDFRFIYSLGKSTSKVQPYVFAGYQYMSIEYNWEYSATSYYYDSTYSYSGTEEYTKNSLYLGGGVAYKAFEAKLCTLSLKGDVLGLAGMVSYDSMDASTLIGYAFKGTGLLIVPLPFKSVKMSAFGELGYQYQWEDESADYAEKTETYAGIYGRIGLMTMF